MLCMKQSLRNYRKHIVIRDARACIEQLRVLLASCDVVVVVVIVIVPDVYASRDALTFKLHADVFVYLCVCVQCITRMCFDCTHARAHEG